MIYENLMEPPWKLFDYPQLSMGWRMGGGEDYLSEWEEWFEHLGQEQQQAYVVKYPEPEDWFEFYHLRLAQNQDERHRCIERLSNLRKAYCEKQYELALQYEQAQNFEKALVYFSNILFFNTAYPVWDERQIHEAVTHYKTLKRHVVCQMQLNPVVQASWEALHQRKHGVSIDIAPGNLSAEQYEQLRTAVLFPSESGLGRTWTKCVHGDTLYLHRHWNEPCVFLVMLKAIGQRYHIDEAWMSTDPAIPQPLSRPTREPEDLLAQLLHQLLYRE